ncbi:class I SAM-dependent methyltransferase [Castellaniella defragrans]|uniref:2-polyprenyl-3-methyl-5-hydroxy-6-metoxy-1, 4-benzoquinol methylase n=3 Tax=Castellaniella defragrans TaxID=75697 RepID=A0A7W9TNP4_CASDE|nr:class I SAM-dependent methyltransferase [Castellaniella defragrans]MBB6084098.1 2-polyprenyl-3-methyl-5-hydroxy-6-metoxy-1,4-benzoquinol methylase [Castellaniella defragrans]
MSRYDYQFDPDDDSTPARICRLVGADRRVLELGCAAGAMSTVLARHYRCRVVGLEADSDAVAQARGLGVDARVADLDSPHWADGLDAAAFDTVLAADVLEHLRDPLACLRRVRVLLGEGGRLVVSVPNIAHSGVLAALLCDAFPYRDTGLLDRTHVHFFTRSSLAHMLARAGFAIDTVQTVDTGPHHPEFSAYWDALPDALRQRLAGNPAGRAYQVIVRASACAPAAGLAEAEAEADTPPPPQRDWLRALAADLDAAAALPAAQARAEAVLAERDQALAQMEAMRRSRSWRWTAFLRRR